VDRGARGVSLTTREAVLRCRAAGLTGAATARVVGRSPRRVAEIVAAARLAGDPRAAPRQADHDAATRHLVLDLWFGGEPTLRIGEWAELTPGAVRQIVRRARNAGDPRATRRTMRMARRGDARRAGTAHLLGRTP
jgi:hypothetical protein